MKKGSILVIDDNKNVLAALRLLLTGYYEKVRLLSSPNQIHMALREEVPDVVLLDMNFSAGINSGNEGLFWLSEIKKFDADIPVVLFTAYADVELAVKALHQGANDFVVKPWDNAKLLASLQSAYSIRQLRNEVKQLKDKQSVLQSELNKEPDICWGVSKAMMALQKIIEKVAKTDANILITGENGTGKEVVAREIHRLSQRNKEIMIAVDMGAIAETLFESELFGHVKGSFTDAQSDRTGKFEAADKGTLFLDEIGNLPLAMQSKLLNVLQMRQIVKVGSNHPIPIDIRLICATNLNLHEAVERSAFREDLYYRINTIQLEIPPLRDRVEDIPQLAAFFLKKYARKYNRENLQISPAAMQKLQEYPWAGNIRELQHAMEKAVILSDNRELGTADFLLSSKMRLEKMNQPVTLEEAEKMLIINSLKRNSDNYSQSAEELGITRPTLYSKIKKYGIF
ncbi:MAG: sigma-54 dependent transcriptional regulator [Tannerella sp.]|jgi:DNA-binding NtrC family response regulator|nr:sigma-54 dependent transcriptional regulator [Tannerella sp.]